MAYAPCRPTPDGELLRWLEQERDLEHTVDIALHMALLGARAEAGTDARVPAGWRSVAAHRVRAGQPALSADQVVMDWPRVGRLAERVCAITSAHDPTRGDALGAIADWFAARAARPEELQQAVEAYLGGTLGVVTEPTERQVGTFVMSHAVRPFLRPYAVEVMPLPESQEWPRLSCPVCGGHPDFAAVAADGKVRDLLCARCDAEWVDARIGCAYCGNADPESLGYFLVGAAYRLDACERCHRYLKTVDFRKTWLRRPLALERILTPTMDLAARQEGYRAA